MMSEQVVPIREKDFPRNEVIRALHRLRFACPECSQPRAVMPAAKNQRPAVLPSRACSQSNFSLPVASFVAPSGRDETSKVWCLPAIAPSAVTGRKPTTADAAKIGSLPVNRKLRIARK